MAMASSFFFIIFIYAFFFLISVPSSSSKLLLFPLTHSLSNSQFNHHHHLLKSTTSRSATRFHNHNRQVSVALSPGSDYTMSFSLGSAPVTLYMDTGSDTVWLPCKPFTCIMCEGKSDPKTTPPPHNLNLSASASAVTCQSRACSAVHSNLPTSDLCAMARCPLESIEMSECHKYSCPAFYYAYGDGSFVGRLYKDNLQIDHHRVNNFTFGCAHESLGEPIGVAGFGRGPLSLPAQLAHFSPHLGTQFSYCLVSHSFDTDRLRQPSPLILGRVDSNKAKRLPSSTPQPEEEEEEEEDLELAYTPMLENSQHPYYYYVGLEGISVGKQRLAAPENMKRIDGKGKGGMVVDSGTTYSMLPEGFYKSVVSEFGKGMRSGHKRAKAVEDRTGLSPCYYYKDEDAKGVLPVPEMVLHFVGNSSVVMPRRNYYYEFTDIENDIDDGKVEVKVKRKAGCMMLMNGGYFPESESGGPAGLLGNYQQQGLEVVYDLLNKRVGFARRKCASLWDNFT